jgi:hypothetical protein
MQYSGDEDSDTGMSGRDKLVFEDGLDAQKMTPKFVFHHIEKFDDESDMEEENSTCDLLGVTNKKGDVGAVTDLEDMSGSEECDKMLDSISEIPPHPGGSSKRIECPKKKSYTKKRQLKPSSKNNDAK